MYTSKGFFRAYTSPLHPPVREWEPRNQMVAPGDLNPYLKDKKINKELYPVINVSDCGFAIEVPNNELYKFFSKTSKNIPCKKSSINTSNFLKPVFTSRFLLGSKYFREFQEFTKMLLRSLINTLYFSKTIFTIENTWLNTIV